MIADTCCSVADTLYICIHEYRKLSTKYITQPDVVICGRDTVWLHCQHSPATSACYQHGHDSGDRNVRCPCWETGEFYSKHRWTPPSEVTLIQKINQNETCCFSTKFEKIKLILHNI